MGCESLYRLWNSHLARKGIIQFAALVLISQVEWAYLPVAGYLRQMDSRAAELSLTERAIAMESAYYYYGAYLTAESEAVAVGVKDAGTQAAKTEESKTDAGVAGAVESETEAAKTAVDTAGAEKTETEAAKTEAGAAGAEITETEGTEAEDAGGSELTERAELADLEAEGVQDAQTEALEEMRIQIVDSDEQGTPAGIQIQPEIQEGMLKEQNRSGNKSTEIPQEEYFKQMLRENGMEDVDNNLTESESEQNEETYYEVVPKEQRKGKVQINVSTSFFVPKPFTPFQWAPMYTEQDFVEKAKVVKNEVRAQLNQRSIRYNWHEPDVTALEGFLARGDRRCADVILKAYEKGALYDAWTENFDYNIWKEAMAECGVDMTFYTLRERSLDEILPWDFIDTGVSRRFLEREWQRAKEGVVTENCRQKCSACGAMKFKGGVCLEGKN